MNCGRRSLSCSAQRGFFVLKRGGEVTDDIKNAVGSANGFRALAVLAGTDTAEFSRNALMVGLAGLEPPFV